MYIMKTKFLLVNNCNLISREFLTLTSTHDNFPALPFMVQLRRPKQGVSITELRISYLIIMKGRLCQIGTIIMIWYMFLFACRF